MSKPTVANVLFWCVTALAAVTLNALVLLVAGVLPGVSSEDAPATSTAAVRGPVADRSTSPPTPSRSPTAAETSSPPATKPVTRALVVLTAARGDSWFSARLGSENGRVLDERVLTQGESARFEGRKVWLTVGAAGNVDLTVNGKPHAIAPGTISLTLSPLR